MSSPERDGEPVDDAPEPSPAPTDGWSAVDRLLGERADDADGTTSSGAEQRPSAEERGWPSSPSTEERGWPSSHGVGWPSEDDERPDPAASASGPAASAPPAPVAPPDPSVPSTPPAGPYAAAPTVAPPPVGPAVAGPYAPPRPASGSHASSGPWGPPPLTTPRPSTPPGARPPLDGSQWDALAVGAFVVSVASMFCLNVAGPVGIVLGAVALQRVAHNGLRGRGLAGWAIGIGAVSSLIGLLFLVGVLADGGLL